MELDLSPLEGLNIPEIKVDPKDEIQIDYGQNSISDKDKEEFKDIAINEVESLTEWNKPEPEKQVIEKKNEAQETEDAEEVETEVEPEVVETKETKSEEEQSANKVWADFLREKEVINFEDTEFEDSEDWVSSKLNATIEAKADEKLKEYPEVIHELAKSYKEGVPLDELIYSKSREIEYSNITEEALKKDPELQKKMVGDYLANQDYEDSEIDTRVQKYEDTGLLEEESLLAHKKLVKFEQKYQEQLKKDAEVRTKERERQYQEQIKNIETTINTAKELIPGVKLTKESRKRIFDAYTKVDSKRESALTKAIKADPNAWLKITQFMVDLGGKFENMQAAAETKAVKKVKQGVDATYTENKSNKIDDSALKIIKNALKQVKTQRLKQY